jgi:hypothetical protein
MRVPTRRELGLTALGVVAALVAANGLSLLAPVLGVEPVESVLDPYITAQPLVLVAMAVLSLVVVAPAEELLFRGAIQGRLGRAFGAVGAVALSSLVFGAFHVANFESGLVGVAFATSIVVAVGLILGALYERTGNLTVPILVHGVYNFVLLTAAYAAVVGWI